MGRLPVVASLALAAAGCASPWPPPRSRAAEPIFRLAAERPAPPPAPALPTRSAGNPAISIEIRVDGGDGRTVVAPRLATWHGQRANVSVFNEIAIVRDFDVEVDGDSFIADPAIGIVQEGVVLDMTARPSSTPGRTALAYEVRTAHLRRPVETFPVRGPSGDPLFVQTPTLDRSGAAGVRPVEHGVWSLLARIPGAGDEPLSILARVEEIRFEGEPVPIGEVLPEGFAEEAALAAEEPEPERERRPRAPVLVPPSFLHGRGESLPKRAAEAPLPEAPSGHLEIRAVVLRTEFEPGSVAEAHAVAGPLSGAEPLARTDLHLATGLVPGARAECLLQESFVKDYRLQAAGRTATADPEVGEQLSGLAAEVEEGGALRLTWVATPSWETFTFDPAGDGGRLALEIPSSTTHEARVVPGEGTRLVVLARLADGRSAAVLVRFRSE